MYTLDGAIGRLRNQGSYTDIDVSGQALSSLFLEYDHLYLYLTHSLVPGERFGMDLTSLQTGLGASTDTVDQWLASLGNSALPTDSPPKELKVSAVTYKDAVRAGCNLQRVYRESHPDSDYPLDDRRNLLIQSPDATSGYVQFHRNHLITLGGYLHRSSHTAHGVLVPHAVETLEHSNVDTVGLVSFEDLGGVTQIHLEPEDLAADGNGNPLGKRFAIDFDNSIADRQVGVVILGRLILDPTLIRKFNTHRLLVDIEHLDLETLYQHALHTIPLGDLPVEAVRGEGDVVLIDKLRSDDTIRAIMALPQSFVVVFEAERLVEDFYPLANCSVSGRAIAHEEPTEPVIGAHGLYLDYWLQEDWDQWVLNFPPQWVRRYFHDTINSNDRQFTTGHHGTVIPRRFPHPRRHRLETHTLE